MNSADDVRLRECDVDIGAAKGLGFFFGGLCPAQAGFFASLAQATKPPRRISAASWRRLVVPRPRGPGPTESCSLGRAAHGAFCLWSPGWEELTLHWWFGLVVWVWI